jgi:hypothetical protein
MINTSALPACALFRSQATRSVCSHDARSTGVAEISKNRRVPDNFTINNYAFFVTNSEKLPGFMIEE